MEMFSQQARGQHFCGHSQMFLTSLDRTHDGSFRGFSQFLSAPSNPCRPGARAVLESPAPAWCRHPRPPGGAAPRGSQSGRGTEATQPLGRAWSPYAPAARPMEGQAPSSRSSCLQRARSAGGPRPGGLGGWVRVGAPQSLGRRQVTQTQPARPSPKGQGWNVGLTATLNQSLECCSEFQPWVLGPGPETFQRAAQTLPPHSAPSPSFVRGTVPICILKALRRPPSQRT